jgi:hypothetical protein
MPEKTASNLVDLISSLQNRPLSSALSCAGIRIEPRTVGEAEQFETAGIKAVIVRFDLQNGSIRHIRLLGECFDGGTLNHTLVPPEALPDELAGLCARRLNSLFGQGNRDTGQP